MGLITLTKDEMAEYVKERTLPPHVIEELARQEREKGEKQKITEEMRKQLRGPFPPEAYQAIEGKLYLTTLKAIYVPERLNDVFGVGRWTLEHKVERIFKTKDKDGNQKETFVLMSGELKIFDYDVVVPRQYGGHQMGRKNSDPADSYKSAITDILSKTASYLEIGIDMFKGKVDHRDVQGSLKAIRKGDIRQKLGELKPFMEAEELHGSTEAFTKELWDEAEKWISTIEQRLYEDSVYIPTHEELEADDDT